LNPAQLECLAALVDCLIPRDSLGPSATESGVVDFISRQLSGEYGAGRRTHLADREPPLIGIEDIDAVSPRVLYQEGITALNALAQSTAGLEFKKLSDAGRHQLLLAIERHAVNHPWIASFLDQVLINTMEGYFSDPRHGGNRNAAGWKMVGFPGCGHDYRDFVGKNLPVSRLVPIQTIADFEGRR
jgi:gluconate 2-dehydrogenase gamma chain